MMRKVIFLLLITCVFAVAITLVHSQNGSRQDSIDAEAELKTNQEIAEFYQSFPTMQRTLLLSTETLDQSFRKLAEYDDGQYFEPGYIAPDDYECTDLQMLLSNRRVIKILQEFEKLTLDQAKIKAKEFHKIAVNHVSKVINTSLDQYEASPGPLPASDDDKHAKYMVITSLLLSASLGDVPFLMQRIDELEQVLAVAKNRVQTNKIFPSSFAKGFSLENSFYFDTTSFVSIMMFALEKKGYSPEAVKTKIANAGCRVADIPIVSWDANKTYHDDLKFHGNGSISWENLYTSFRIYRFPHDIDPLRKQGYEFFRSLQETMVSSR